MEWIKKNWMFLAVVAAAVLILSVVIILVMPGASGKDPMIGNLPEGPETGVYYYDTEDGEYILSLNSGNMFTIAGPDLNKTGTYSVTENGIELDFVRDEDGTGTIVQDGSVLNLRYKENTMRFIRKTMYTVTFYTDGGSAIDSVNVMNGKTLPKPIDPVKEGSIFLGWYTDAECTKLYSFGTEVITGNITVYARWAETVVGQNEYTIDFDLGYESNGYASVTTVGGKLFSVPTPEREGYTFCGWWISMSEQADMLTMPYTDETVFQANTTLFALWQQDTVGSKLAAPLVEVHDSYVSWKPVKNASSYHLKITGPQNEVVVDKTVGATTENVDFGNRPAGMFTVEVTALSAVEVNNSDTTVRVFINKALDRVSLFTVIDGGILLWNRVEGAEKYKITVDCGNDAHNHTDFENGESTTFLFMNCAMQEGGIRFTVTAMAEGMASSVSETFVYDRTLDAIDRILYNEETQVFYWNAIANATNYYVTLIMGEERVIVDNGSATTFSVKHLSGEIKLEVVPVTQGYNIPIAATITYHKTTLAAPTGLTVMGNVLSWNSVDGATSYNVKINNQTFQCTANSMDLTAQGLALNTSTTYEISVMAIGSENSLYSDVLAVKYLSDIETVTYKNNTVSWTPVIGVEQYEVRVNGQVVAQVTNTVNYQIKLTKAGVNVIEVRCADQDGSNWTSTEVIAYKVTYDSRSLNGIREEFLAIGDTMSMPTDFEHEGYDFDGWYNSPDGAAGNGARITDTRFYANGAIVLYGNWTPKTFQVKFYGLNGIKNMNEGDTQDVRYKSSYRLPVPEVGDEMGEFMGWYTAPGGSGVLLTDTQGNCLQNYDVTRDTSAYPAFNNGVLSYIPQSDGTYAVTRGPNSASATTITIPEFYKNVPVTTVLDNAFYGMTKVEMIRIPATIQLIGVGAIPNTESLKEIVVYKETIQQNYEIFYSSADGALLRHDMGSVYLEIFPRGKTGEYVIPDEVNVLRDNVFYNSKITKLTVGTGVNEIAKGAFYNCKELKSLEFKDGGVGGLTIDSEAFYRTTNLETLHLPARLINMDLQIINQFTKLKTLEVESGGQSYSSMNNGIYNADGSALLFAPMNISGEYKFPVNIRSVGPYAFSGRKGITKIIVPAYVNNIDKYAFLNCDNVTEVVFEGARPRALTIGEEAFQGCESISKITFCGNATGTLDAGNITIGRNAFAGINLLTAVVFESGVNVTEIGYGAFSNNKNLSAVTYVEDCYIGTIGDYAYANCVNLKEAVIPATTTTLGNKVFSGCERIQKVSFQSRQGEVTFGTNVFEGCVRLTTVYLPATLAHFSSSVFAGCDAIREIVVDEANQNFVTCEGALYSANYEELMFYPRALGGELKLHSNTKKIGDHVFQGNPDLVHITLGSGIVEIGDYAFEDCRYLESVTFEAGSTAMRIGANAFAGCDLLTTVALPAATTYIGDSAFEGTPLTAFTIPENVTYLGMNALKGTLITEIHIPANMETIGDGAFAGCTLLTTLTIAEGTAPLQIGTLGNADENNGVFCGTAITAFAVPDRVTLIGAYAFYQQTFLKTLTMSQNSQVTDIGQYAFAVMMGTGKLPSSLTTATFGGKLETIHEYAFYNTQLDGLVIPKSVILIADYAFYGIPASNVTFELGGTENLSIEEYAFASTRFAEITLPDRLTTAYQFEGGVKTFYKIFANNGALSAVYVEAGNPYFKSIDGIVYELNSDGVADILLYCPSGKTGDLLIAKEVRIVEYNAFANTKLSSITFDEYPEGHEYYGKPLLVIGAQGIANGNPGEYVETYGVISRSSTLEVINFPSHLMCIGGGSFLELDAEMNFNMDAHLVSVGTSAFQRCTFTQIQLPLVDEFGEFVFVGCGLTSFAFHPDSVVTTIPVGMFKNNLQLETIEIPASVITIKADAFYGCTALISITFEDGCQLETIEEQAFAYTAITDFVMPESVRVAGVNIFMGGGLRTITVSKNLQAAIELFQCANLEAIHVPEENQWLKSVDGVLYDYSQSILYCFPRAKDPAGFVLPDSLVTIEHHACQYFPGSSLVLPESLETIAEYAFYFCNLESIHFPKNVKTIGANAFSTGSNNVLSTITFALDGKLESIGRSAFSQVKIVTLHLPDSLKTIGNNCFYKCVALEEVILPAAMANLNSYVFAECKMLRKVVMQEGLQTIQSYAFQGAVNVGSLLNEITIPSTVTAIGLAAFQNLENLKTVTFAEGSKLEQLGSHAFDGCVSLESITLPARLKTIQTAKLLELVDGQLIEYVVCFTFRNCRSLKSVDMSACVNMEKISLRTFDGCVSLETLRLPPNLMSIDDCAFGDPLALTYYQASEPLVSLKEITIPASVVSIGGYVFYGCESLETVTFEAGSQMNMLGTTEVRTNQPLWGLNIFAETPSLKTACLPENLMSIGIGCFENSGLEAIDLPDSISVIATRAFKNCDNITSVELPTGLRYLGDHAFSGCENLETADIQSGLEVLGSSAFAGCAKLEKAYIPASVSSISGNPFIGCSGVQTVVLDSANKNFCMVDGVLYDAGMNTLYYYPPNLADEVFEIPEEVSEIAEGAFADSQIKIITIPNLITRIPAYAFQNSQLESVTLHKNIIYVGDHAFDGCANLNNVTLPRMVEYAGHYAFANCTNLKNFVFEDVTEYGKPYTIGQHFFDGCTSMSDIILPNRMVVTDLDNCTVKDGAIPGYMFANTGIKHAKIPAQIVDLSTEGVFANCTKLRKVTFDNLVYQGRGLGTKFFYGCTTLREISIPSGMKETLSYGSYIFAGCTSLENVTCHYAIIEFDLGAYVFYNCTKLKKITVKTVGYSRDENGVITGYVGYETGFSGIYDGALNGCVNLKSFPIKTGAIFEISGTPFKDSGIESLAFTSITMHTNDAIFADMESLKEIRISSQNPRSDLYAKVFADVEAEVDVYFYTETFEEVVQNVGNRDWYDQASDKVTFHFKDEETE